MTRTAPITGASPTVREMEDRVARFTALRPTNDYVDAGIPGCERTTWAPTALGPFAPVFVNDGLTLDFIDPDEDFPIYHFCFRVAPAEFDAILGRIKAAGIAFRGTVRGPMDMQVSTEFGGRGIYWNEPDGHQWEMLTVSYARPAAVER